MKNFFGFNRTEMVKLFKTNRIQKYELTEYLLENSTIFCDLMNECPYVPSLELANTYFAANDSLPASLADKEMLIKKYGNIVERYFKSNKAGLLKLFIEFIFDNISSVYSTSGTDKWGVSRVSLDLLADLKNILALEDPFPSLLMMGIKEIADTDDVNTYRQLNNTGRHDPKLYHPGVYKKEADELKALLLQKVEKYEHSLDDTIMENNGMHEFRIVMRTINVIIGTSSIHQTASKSMMYKLRYVVEGNRNIDRVTDEDLIMSPDLFGTWATLDYTSVGDKSPNQLDRLIYLLVLLSYNLLKKYPNHTNCTS